MRILFFARRFYPEIGGVEKHVFEISKRLVSLGHSVTIISEGIHNIAPQGYFSLRDGATSLDSSLLAMTGIKSYKIPVSKDEKKKKFQIWRWLWNNRELIRDADIIHCHDVSFWYLPFRFLFPEKPVYTTFHGYEGYPIKQNAVVVRKFSEKLSWGNICIGDFITKWYGTKPTIVSYGAVTVKSPVLRDTLIKGGKEDSALFFGRLDDQTCVMTYVAGFELLKKQFPKFELLVMGEGKYKTKIAKKAKHLDFQKNPERYLERYHFAFVSRYLSILEAFAANRLVFAVYDNPIKEDYLRLSPFAKWLIIAKDPSELAEQVTYFLEHPEEEQKRIDKAFSWVKKQTWEAMVQNYLMLWKKTS